MTYVGARWWLDGLGATTCKDILTRYRGWVIVKHGRYES